jgi:hypothetical protein
LGSTSSKEIKALIIIKAFKLYKVSFNQNASVPVYESFIKKFFRSFYSSFEGDILAWCDSMELKLTEQISGLKRFK